MKNNEEFFNEINKNIGVEAFEEFKESEFGNTLSKLNSENVDLVLLAEIIGVLKMGADNIKDILNDESKTIQAVIDYSIYKYALEKTAPTLLEELKVSSYVLSDAYIEMLRGE